MRRIRLHTIMQGPEVNRQPGIHDVDDDEAEALFAARHAEPHDDDGDGRAPEFPPETPETADAPPEGSRATSRRKPR